MESSLWPLALAWGRVGPGDWGPRPSSLVGPHMCRGQWTGVPTGPGVTNCTPTDPPPSWTGPRGWWVPRMPVVATHAPNIQRRIPHTCIHPHLSHFCIFTHSGHSSRPAIHGSLPTMKTPSEQTPIEVAVCGGDGGPASGLSVVSGISILCRTHGPITAGMARPDSPQT